MEQEPVKIRASASAKSFEVRHGGATTTVTKASKLGKAIEHLFHEAVIHSAISTSSGEKIISVPIQKFQEIIHQHQDSNEAQAIMKQLKTESQHVLSRKTREVIEDALKNMTEDEFKASVENVVSIIVQNSPTNASDMIRMYIDSIRGDRRDLIDHISKNKPLLISALRQRGFLTK